MFSFYNIFFCIQKAFMFHFLAAAFVFHNHMRLLFSRAFFWNSFFIIFITFRWWIFWHFYICKQISLKKGIRRHKKFQVNFIMICLIHKNLALLKITIILKCFLRTITELHLKKLFFFFAKHSNGKPKAWRRKHNYRFRKSF